MKRTRDHLASRPGRLLLGVIVSVMLTLAFLLPRLGSAAALGASPDPAPAPDPAPLAADIVSADGGAVNAGGVTVTIPADGLSTPTQIAIVAATGMPAFDGTPPLLSFMIQAAAVDTRAAVATFGTRAGLDVSLDALDLTGIDAADLRLAALMPGGDWQALPTRLLAGTITASIGAPGTFAVVVDEPAHPVGLALGHASDAPDRGRHRVGPGDTLTLSVGVTPDETISATQLAESVPDGWTVVDAAGGSWDAARRLLTWDLGRIPARGERTRSFVARAPLVSPADGAPAFESTFAAHVVYRGGSMSAGEIVVLVSPPVVVEHRVLATIDRSSLEASYLPEDSPILDAQRSERFRVRFQLRNADTVPVRLTPQLEYRAAGASEYTVVPAESSVPGIALFVAPEWTRPPSLNGLSEVGPQREDIGVGALKEHDKDEPAQTATPGEHSMGQNPAQAVTLPPLTFTEVEFTVYITMDAEHLTTYELRVTDAGATLPGAVTATVSLGPEPPAALSPGQRQGRPVEGGRPAPASNGSRSLASAVPRYALLASVAAQPAPVQRFLAAAVVGTHGPYSTVADQCAICHRGHTGVNKSVLNRIPPQSVLCFNCHDGSGANTNVSAQYTDPLVPANSAATRDYYRHDALVTTTHTRAQLNEFGGALNRHSECGDCHNAHKASSAASTQAAAGWTTSGRLANISGVSVVNGAAGTSPTYTFLDGSTTPTYEYQVCFKCHSGFTTLNSNTGFTPSKYHLDKGVELNPANGSYHPVEAAGKNTTADMTANLAATSPYKQWTFTTGSTIRCTNCHASSTTYNQATPPAAGSDLPPHTSRYRGILLQNYRDRVLETSTAAYAAADFALCFMCHGEAPFATETATATNFKYHGFHIIKLAGMGSGSTDIDTAGAGQGNAICAECHFRIHSTTYKDGTQTLTGSRLVNFAPNVQASGGTRSWTTTGVGSGSCTLTCHGKSHTPKSYSP